MPNQSVSSGKSGHREVPKTSLEISPEHYLRLIWHRKWLVLGTFLLVSVMATSCGHLTDEGPSSSSETVILVDPQKVPDRYVKSTVTGDVRNRLGNLSQQILSATQLQKIIEKLNLYSQDRKILAREDVISKMRKDIAVNVVTEFSAGPDLQAFRIGYSGSDRSLVAQVANELATLFIDENLKTRERQATGTTDFLKSQLEDARKTLEAQEEKLRDFRMRHIGEMPEQQTATLQVLGQLQSQLQLESEALARAEQQKGTLQAMMSQGAPVVDLDDVSGAPSLGGQRGTTSPATSKSSVLLQGLRTELSALQARGYTDTHPSVRALKVKIADAEKNDPAPKDRSRGSKTGSQPCPRSTCAPTLNL